MRRIVAAAVLALLPVPLLAQGIVAKSGASSDLLTIDTNKNARTSEGASTRATYIANASGLTAATAHTLAVDAAAGTGFKLAGFCVATSNATAASTIAITVQRRTTATTGGTLCTNNGTGTSCNVTTLGTAGTFGGSSRVDGTLGTAGAVIDQYNYQVGIIATGAGSSPPFCIGYDLRGVQLPTAAAGTANSIVISVPSFGAGSLATSISATLVEE